MRQDHGFHLGALTQSLSIQASTQAFSCFAVEPSFIDSKHGAAREVCVFGYHGLVTFHPPWIWVSLIFLHGLVCLDSVSFLTSSLGEFFLLCVGG